MCPFPRATYRVGRNDLLYVRLGFIVYDREWQVIADVENGGGLCQRTMLRNGRITEIIWLNENGRMRLLFVSN